MKTIMTLLLAASTLSLAAKSNKPDVIGTVLDENGQPMPYVNVVLLSLPDSTYIQGATSDETGAFHIQTPEKSGLLRISTIGYDTQYMLVPAEGFGSENCVIRMQENAHVMTEVTVKSTLPRTRLKGDAMQTIVDGTILEKAGSATDVLNRIPSVSAERDGGVEVFGRGAAEVYINGRKVLDEKELSRLRSEQIKSIEVVQNPGARYAASTKAVVRIYLKKAQGEGFSFIENAMGIYQYDYTATNNLDVNYRKGGLDVTTSFWAGSYGHNKSLQENDLIYNMPDGLGGIDHIVGHSTQEHSSRWNGVSPQIQVNYMFNENHSMGAFYKYDRNLKNHQGGMLYTESYKNGEYIERCESEIYRDRQFSKHIFNAYYNGRIGKLGIDANVDGLFDDSKDNSPTDEITLSGDPVTKTHRFVENITNSNDKLLAGKLVFTYPIWKGNLSAGAEYAYTKRNDSYRYTADEEGTDIDLPVSASDNTIKESATAGFVEYGRSFGKLYAQVGVRYEYLNNNYYKNGVREDEVCRSYGNVFPTAVLSLPIKDVQMSLSYRQDINRPAYENLSNSTIYINRYTYQCGNPYLRPNYIHNVVYNLAYKAFNFSLNYSNNKDSWSMYTRPFPGSEDPLISLIRAENAEKHYNRVIIAPSYHPTIAKIWHPMWSAALVLQDFETLCSEGYQKKLNHPFLQAVWNNDLELPHDWRLNTHMQLTTKGDYDNIRMTRVRFSNSLGVQKDFNLKHLGVLTAAFELDDPFNIDKGECVMYGPRDLTSVNPNKRTFTLNLTWKFNEASKKYKGTGAGSSQKARMK